MAPVFKEHDLSDDGYCIEELVHGDEEEGDDDNDVSDNLHHHDERRESNLGGETRENIGGNDSLNNTSTNITTITMTTPITKQKHPTVVQVLLKAGADSQKGHTELKNGRLPLHFAIVSGKRWHEGVQVMMNSYLDSLARQDKDTGLFVFMLTAAVGKGQLQKEVTTEERVADLNTIYEILRCCPESILIPQDSN